MYAIVNIAGQQFKVEKDQKLFVHRLENKEGDAVRFDEVLLIDNDKNILVGEPTIKGAMITGKVLSHAKADKIKVFKKKRRKGYKVLNGHRQSLTEIQIQEIVEKGAAKKTETTKAAPAKKVATGKKASEEVKAAPAAKSAPEKKPAADKKPAAKPAAEKKAAAPKKDTEKKTSGTTTAKTTTAKKSTGAGTKAAPKKPAADKKD